LFCGSFFRGGESFWGRRPSLPCMYAAASAINKHAWPCIWINAKRHD
jgi:hypothetical protein